MDIVRFREHIHYSSDRPDRFQCIDTPQVYAFMFNFAPGQGVAPHTHSDSKLIVQVLVGQMAITVDGEPATLSAGEVIYVNGQQYFGMFNETKAPASVYITLTPKPVRRR